MGWLFPAFGGQLQPLADGFVKLVKMPSAASSTEQVRSWADSLVRLFGVQVGEVELEGPVKVKLCGVHAGAPNADNEYMVSACLANRATAR